MTLRDNSTSSILANFASEAKAETAKETGLPHERPAPKAKGPRCAMGAGLAGSAIPNGGTLPARPGPNWAVGLARSDGLRQLNRSFATPVSFCLCHWAGSVRNGRFPTGDSQCRSRNQDRRHERRQPTGLAEGKRALERAKNSCDRQPAPTTRHGAAPMAMTSTTGSRRKHLSKSARRANEAPHQVTEKARAMANTLQACCAPPRLGMGSPVVPKSHQQRGRHLPATDSRCPAGVLRLLRR